MRSWGWYPEAGPRRRHARRVTHLRRSKQPLPARPGTTTPPTSSPLNPHTPPKRHLGRPTPWKTSATDGVAEEMWEVRSNEETEKSQASVNLDTPLGIQMSAGRRPPFAGRRGVNSSIKLRASEIPVNSATAEQTTLRKALWRRTLSPPQHQERAWSPQRCRTSPHMPHAESWSQSGMRRPGWQSARRLPRGSGTPRDADDDAWGEEGRERCGTQIGPQSCQTGTSGRRSHFRHKCWPEWDDSPQSVLGSSLVTPIIKVERIKSWPQLR